MSIRMAILELADVLEQETGERYMNLILPPVAYDKLFAEVALVDGEDKGYFYMDGLRIVRR